MSESVLHYDIVKKIGEGGMGSVFLAVDTKLKRNVALKFLPDQIYSDQSVRQRFKTEAQAAAALSHPNIAQVHAIEESGDNLLFIVMEYIEGQALKRLIESGTLTQEEKIQITLQIAKALTAAHANGILHRDIKSSNIMLDKHGTAKILDFGLARIQGAEHLTKTGAVAGTTAYMSPEQIQGREVDEQTDIWSFGVVLYELFSGEMPFRDLYEAAVFYKIINDEPKRINEINPDIPDYIVHIIHGCLQKDKKDRYRMMASVVDDLESQSTETALSQGISGKRRQLIPTFFWVMVPVLMAILFFLSPFSKNIIQSNSPKKLQLAILPIDNIGDDSTYQVISEGLVETLSGKLSQVDQYRNSFSVVPSSEIRARGINSTGMAKKIFGINLAVEASLQPFADSTRFIIKLIDADHIRQLDTKIIDVPTHSLAALQNDAVSALLEMLNIESDSTIDMAIRKGDPAQPDAMKYYLMGRAYLQRPSTGENINHAILLFKKAVEEDSSYALAYAALGESYWHRFDELKNAQDVESAKRYVNKAQELNDDLAEVKITRGIIYRGMGEYDNAINSFNEALEIDPKNADAYRNLAKAYETKGMTEKAEMTYKEAINLDPESWLVYNQLGSFYARQEQNEEALKQFQHVIDLAPDNYLGYSNKGGVYLKQRKFQEAGEMFEQSLALDTTYSAATNLGITKYYEKEYADAIKWYNVALKINPDNYLMWANLASVCEMLPGRKNEALQYYRKAIKYGEAELKINPNDATLNSHLGSYSLDVGDTTKAQKYTERALNLNSDNINIQYTSATIYERIGDRERALHLVGKALKNGYPLESIQNSPYLKSLKKDEKFKKMVRETSQQQ